LPDGISFPPVNVAGILSAIPAAATTMPPSVTDSGAVGSMTPYARSDHTHASKARKQRITGVSTAVYTWVYPTAFATGVVPICNGIAEDPSANAADSYNVQIEGVPTNTQCTFRIKRQSSGLLLTLLGAISLNPTPGNINLHCLALEP